MAEEKKPDDIDRHVGERVRVRRIMVGMSQGDLGKKLGITFQQIQKYENGANRISASRLYRTAQILRVPVSFFFEGLPTPNGHVGDGAMPDHLMDLMGTALGQRLVKGLGSISDRNMRYGFLQLIEGIRDMDRELKAREQKNDQKTVSISAARAARPRAQTARNRRSRRSA